MSAFKEDGDFNVASPTGPKRWFSPFHERGDNVTRGYEQDYIQRMSKWKPSPISSRGAEGTYLVEETNPQHIGGDIGQFMRRYVQVPIPNRTYESHVYTYQSLQGEIKTHWNGLLVTQAELDSLDALDLVEFTLTVPSTTVHDYFWAPGTTADNIPLGVAFRIFRSGDGFKALGGFKGKGVTFKNEGKKTKWKAVKVTLDGTMILAEDSTLQRWEGEIYERVSRYVPLRAPLA
jgi:hypothetical protein